ncbi:MAG: dUTP diphosphatase [Gemmatimonadaceae bacterium]
MTNSPSAHPRVRVRRLPHGLETPLPARATSGSAGYDVCSAETDFVLPPGGRRAVATGLIFELPLGMEMQVRPRSGLALKHGITLPNAPGTLDSDYRGELQVIMLNHGSDPVEIRCGDRIAQLVFARYEVPDIEETSELSETGRGIGGFGSTGR